MKNVSQFATIKEVRGRIDVISADLNKKLDARLKIETFKSSISLYDIKIE